MIAYVKGTLADITSEQAVIIESGGMGFEILVPTSVIPVLPPVGSEIKLHTHFQVREDAMNLYGFLTKEDLKIFTMLIGVNGIGPKGALGILSAITPDELRFAVLADDVKAICKAPGIGTKTAQKMIIELRDKLKLSDVFNDNGANESGAIELGVQGTDTKTATGDIRKEAIMALVALGYSSSEATKAVGQVDISASDDMTVEELLKAALKKIF
ncbi:MAG: Holliday junction branch migration protein RuvA [Lachnospiraceae bacterium]|nr:Holliday junction branch migration protein RuvA [Lachnospiraceae bacterium]MBQ9765976.1 Holliday junction branch migration protein RuvA [Lachnospiraceae bacterium]